jgi:hypothetical protein
MSVILDELRDKYMDYRGSIGKYHQAKEGPESARAVLFIKESYHALVRLARKAGVRDKPPRPVIRRHGNWKGWKEWLESVEDWWVDAEAQLTEEQEALVDGKDEDTPPSVDEEDVLILEALAKWPERLFTQEKMPLDKHLNRKTLRKRLNSLEKDKLVHRPKGKKSGWAITPAGLQLLESLRGKDAQ